MPINPALVPLITPGNLFRRLTQDTTLNVRVLVPTDPVYYESCNRFVYDLDLRELIIAKSVDNLSLRISHQTLFPFIIPPKIIIGSTEYDLPISWIWDMHESAPVKWEYIRLQKIMRISGANGSSPTGLLRFVFSGQQTGSTTEVALFYTDYKIDSTLTYQYVKTGVVTSYESPVHIDTADADTIAGFLIFRTLDLSDPTILDFLLLLAPPAVPTDSNNDGIFDNPTSYYLADSAIGGSVNQDDFLVPAIPHGTGSLTVSAFNMIPPSDSDFNLWLSSNNYPFRLGATRTSVHGITIPKALFREFNIVVPSPDEPTDDTSRHNSPVWVSSIERLDSLAVELKFYFSTYNIPLDGSTPAIVEFASLTLDRAYLNNRIVAIEPLVDLFGILTSDSALQQQGFGTGYVVLSSLWGASTSEVNDFFDAFLPLTDVPPATTFSKSASIISSFGVARVPKTLPTFGQSEALRGSTSRRTPPVYPSDSNRYVNELDEGHGDQVDFRTLAGFPDELRDNPDIDPIGYAASRVHKAVVLIVDANMKNHTYEHDILPRLRCLLGRDVLFADIWFDGTYFKMWSGDAWITL